jgi:excinuclease ABC subunit A
VIRENSLGRIAEAVEQATKLASGKVGVYLLPDATTPRHMPGELLQYSLALACPIHGHSIDDLQPRDFSFNAPYGACPDCDGLGFRKTSSMPRPSSRTPRSPLPRASSASSVTRTTTRRSSRAVCAHLGVSDRDALEGPAPKAQKALLDGLGTTKIRVDYRTRDGRNTHWFTTYSGVRKILFDKYQETTSETMKTHLEKYIREVPCPTCHGARLKPEYLAVTVGDKNINEVCDLSCRDCLASSRGSRSMSASR